MAEKDTIYSSKVKYAGVFDYPDFYKFCYDWLVDEMEMFVIEDQYVEKIEGDSKRVDFVWKGVREVTDYFKFAVKVKTRILGMKTVELVQDGQTVKANKGTVEVKISATLIRDYKGRFEEGAFKKFLRAIYEKWVITSRVEQFEEKLAGDADKFLAQVKDYLNLEGKR